MSNLEERITPLEGQRHYRRALEHNIPVGQHPRDFSNENLEVGLATATACRCHPTCPGMTIGVLLPEKGEPYA
jgi:hypothetical protein